MAKLMILFLHGFTSSGVCEIAQTLRSELSGVFEVVAPDLPCIQGRRWICFRICAVGRSLT